MIEVNQFYLTGSLRGIDKDKNNFNNTITFQLLHNLVTVVKKWEKLLTLLISYKVIIQKKEKKSNN